MEELKNSKDFKGKKIKFDPKIAKEIMNNHSKLFEAIGKL